MKLMARTRTMQLAIQAIAREMLTIETLNATEVRYRWHRGKETALAELEERKAVIEKLYNERIRDSP